MSNYTFGNYICELREKKGLTQSQLGEKLGVSNKAISKWENGGAYPSSELMLPLAKELNVSIEELYAAISNSKAEKTNLRLFLDTLTEKYKIIAFSSVSIFALLWILFLIFGNTTNKLTVLIFAPLVTVIIYGFIHLLFWIFKKNPMVSSKYIDFISLFFIILSLSNFVTAIINFIFDFPNGFSPLSGIEIGIICAVLQENKKRT